MIRPMNVIEKILFDHAIGWDQSYVQVGDTLCVNVDWTIASELTFQSMRKLYNTIGQPKLVNPERFWLALDHTVDPRVNDQPKQKALIQAAEDFHRKNPKVDYQPPNQTIMHTEFVKKRVQPGQIVIGADSHTCSAGNMGAFATGLGAGDAVMPLVTGQTWFKVPEVVYVEFINQPKFGTSGKDIILYILGSLKRNTVAFERAVYYAGEGLKYLSIDARFVIANMSTEFGALAGVFESDQLTMTALNKRKTHNQNAKFFRPDPNCNYVSHHVIDLSQVSQLIALFPSPDNCVPLEDKIGMQLDGCFIGACTTTEEDLILAGLVLQQAMIEGKKPIAQGHRRVTPGSVEIMDHLRKLGLLRVYEDAGFIIGAPSCSYCVGIGADQAKEGEVWLSSQNRNFHNRMGKGSIGNLASPACVAASSFTMNVTDPRPYLSKIDQSIYNSYISGIKSTVTELKINEPSQKKNSDISCNPEHPTESRSAIPMAQPTNDIKGRIQIFGPNIDTDAIIPAEFMGLTPNSPLWPKECKTEEEVLASKSFAFFRPEFVSKVKQGYNIIVAGEAFGCGSSREEAATCLNALGVQAVIAKSFAYIYARNQANLALLGIIIKDEKFYNLITEESEICINIEERKVTVKECNEEHTFTFNLSKLEENLFLNGGLSCLFKTYKENLFRIAACDNGKYKKKVNTEDSDVANCKCNGGPESISW